MRLKITEKDVTGKYDWIFVLTDQNRNKYYIMDSLFYEKRNIKNPVSKKELDTYYNGLWITAYTEQIEGKQIVIDF